MQACGPKFGVFHLRSVCFKPPEQPEQHACCSVNNVEVVGIRDDRCSEVMRFSCRLGDDGAVKGEEHDRLFVFFCAPRRGVETPSMVR